MPLTLCTLKIDLFRRSDLFYCNVLYSVAMIPFIVLILPLVSTSITNAEPTGYDRSGQLGGMLTPAMMKRVREFQSRHRRDAARGTFDEEGRSASVRRIMQVQTSFKSIVHEMF